MNLERKKIKDLFNNDQLAAIMKEKERIPGFTWHHHQDVGRMQLIPIDIHRQVGLVGGMKLWFSEK